MKLSTIISLVLISFYAMLVLAMPTLVKADGGVISINIQNPLKYNKIEDIIPVLTDLLKGIAISIGTILVIWGGIQIMTAGGSEEKLTKGKKTIMWTVIGVAIVVLVDTIVGVIKELLGV